MAAELERKYVEYARALYGQGILDTDQFGRLQKLQVESDPHFVRETVDIFFDESERLLNDLNNALNQKYVDIKIVGGHVHQLKGSSSSIGAQRVKNACVEFRKSCEQQNGEGCRKCLGTVHQEYLLVKRELQCLLQMAQAILNAGGTVPIVG